MRGRLLDCRQGVKPLLAQLVGKFHDQDAVFGDQPDQRNQADLAEHIECAAGPFERQQGAGHRERNAEQNHKRVHKTLELGCQYQENEEQREHKHQ